MKKKKKILFLGSLPPPYHGVTVYNYNLLNSKIKKSFNIIHLDTSDKRNLDNLGKFDFTNLYLGLRNILQLVVLLLREKPKIIYLSIAQNKAYLRDGLFIVFAKLFSKAEVVVHTHGIFKDFYDSSSIFMKAFINWTMKTADRFIVLGNSLKYTVERWTKNIEVVPNGIDFYPDLSQKFNNRERIVISYMSSFLKSKGIMDV